MTDSKDKTPKSVPNASEIIKGFQKLRDEQRTLVGKIQELELDRTEHKLVIETLKGVDEGKKCYRMLGGVLVERTVKEVLPALLKNESGIIKVIASLNEQLVKKGKDLNAYREKYGIRVQGDQSPAAPSAPTDSSAPPDGTGSAADSKGAGDAGSKGVLVSEH